MISCPNYKITGEQGFEPRPADPESAVLPLDDSPSAKIILALPADISKLDERPAWLGVRFYPQLAEPVFTD